MIKKLSLNEGEFFSGKLQVAGGKFRGASADFINM